MSLLVAILAGGRGRRIGGNKPGRLLSGRSLLDRAAERAQSWSSDVVLVVRDRRQGSGAAIDLLADDAEIEGPLGGLAAALRHARAVGFGVVLAVPADMPFLPADLPDRLGSAMAEKKAALAASAGRLHPICGLWRPSALDDLPAYLETGSRSLIGFAEAVGFGAAEWPAEPDDPFFNINSADDLRAAERRLSEPRR